MNSVLPVVCGLVAGTALGWVARSSRETGDSGGNARGTGPRTVTVAAGSSTAPGGDAGTRGTAADFLKRSVEAAAEAHKGLGDEAFADKLAALLTKDPLTLAERVEAEALKGEMNPGRFAAFYTAYSRRKNLQDSDMTLNHMLIDIGKEYGKTMLDAMLKEYPEGFERMDSLLHGWAMGDPDGAVRWFNELPENHTRYDKILQGVVWGLAAKDGPMAGEVMTTLSPTDREKAIYGFSSSFIEAHGLGAFDAWVREAPKELAGQALHGACLYASRCSPSESVPWFEAHSGVIGVRGELYEGFDRWFAASAPEAMDWLAKVPVEKDYFRTGLANRVSPAAALRFMEEHPGHPAAALLEAARVAREQASPQPR